MSAGSPSGAGPQAIGRYPILGEIARGGMGVVYRANDPQARRQVAIKLLLGRGRSTPTARKRLRREAEALSRVSHPSVVRIHDYDDSPTGEPYIVMELLAGESLQRRIDRGGAYSPSHAVAIVKQLCQAISACHQAGVLHRDLKPENVLVTPNDQLKLVDFGLSREVESEAERTQLTQAGNFLGSPAHWAPEQAAGRLEQIGTCTDVYGLGAILFSLLTARAPHAGETPSELLTAVYRPKQPPSTLNPQVPRWLDHVVLRALAREPSERFASAEALADALDAKAERGPRRWPLAAAGAVLILGVLALATQLQAPSPPPAQSTSSSTPLVSGSEPAPTRDPQPGRTVDPAREIQREAAALLRRGRELLDEGRPDDALWPLGKAIRLRPDWAEPYYLSALARTERGQLALAIVAHTQAIQRQPDHADAWFSRGRVRGSLQDWRGLRDDSGEAIRLRPRFFDAHLNRGFACGKLGDWEGQLEDSLEAWRLDPSNRKAYANLIYARRQLEDFQGIVDDASTRLADAPTYSWAYRDRASANLALGNLRAAVADYTEAFRYGAESGGGYRERATARGLLQDDAGAIEDLERALELAPEDAAWVEGVRSELAAARDRLADSGE